MKVITTFSVFLILARAHCFTRNSRVFIQFPNIEKYVWKYLQITDTEIDRFDVYKASLRLNYCKKLLAAPLYQIRSSHLIGPPTNENSYHRLDSGKWEELQKLCSMKTLGKRFFNIATHSIQLWSQPCINHASNISWMVTYDRASLTGLLFDENQNYKVSALIDSVNTVLCRTTSDPHKNLLESIKISNSKNDEPLCKLKRSSQFRLCSICATAFLKFTININHQTSSFTKPGITPDQNEYADPNHYFQTAESLGMCPHVNVTNYREITQMNALLCDMYFKGYNHKIFIKMNLADMKNHTDMIYVMTSGTRNSIVIKGDVHVPQLQNILNIDAILDDNDDDDDDGDDDDNDINLERSTQRNPPD